MSLSRGGAGLSSQAGPEREGASRKRLRAILRAHSHHPSVGLALSAKAERLFDRDGDGAIVYRAARGYLYQLGGVFAPPEVQPRLLDAFLELARGRRRRVCAVQLRREDLPLYRSRGFRFNQFGTSYSLTLKSFQMRGQRFVKLRNAISRARRFGVTVGEVGRELPLTAELRGDLDRITNRWLRAKGFHKKLLDFMVGELDGVGSEDKRCFVARREGRVVAFVTFGRAYGRFSGWTQDLTRRVPDSPPGTMDLINHTALERFREEGESFFNFGLTPFVELSEEQPDHSRALAWTFRFAERHASSIYPARSQAFYKRKWGPDVTEPEYLAYPGRLRLGMIWQLGRVTRAV